VLTDRGPRGSCRRAAADFTHPVLQLWPQLAQDYPTVVKQPMDFGTIRRKLIGDEYGSPNDFHADCM
jgi:Bromodomain